MPITPESGKDGSVKIGSTSVGEVTKWSLVKKYVVTKFGSSESAGKKKSIVGVGEISGRIEGKWDSAAASSVEAGGSVTLKLYTNATEFYSIPAKIADFSLECDIDNGTPNAFTASFEGDGAWTEPTLA